MLSWKCRWNVDNGPVYLQFQNLNVNWGLNSNLLNTSTFYLGYELSNLNNTVLFADGSNLPPPYLNYPDNFVVSGSVVVSILNDPNFPSSITTWSQPINWF